MDNWTDRHENGLPPQNQWVEVKGWFGLKYIHKNPFQGKAKWHRKPNQEFFFWELEDGREVGSWYFDVEFWRNVTE